MSELQWAIVELCRSLLKVLQLKKERWPCKFFDKFIVYNLIQSLAMN